MTPRRVVVVGASLAGVRTAQDLRRRGYDGELDVIGAEDVLPYDRPPLSKQVLTGERTPASLDLLAREEYGTAGIGLHLGDRATGVERHLKLVTTAGGQAFPYDALVVATGVRARTLPGTDLPGVVTLRTLADSLATAELLRRSSRLVVVGGGFIGAEVAAVARGAGLEVTVLEATATPLARAIGAEMGEAVIEMHRAAGVDVRCHASFDRVVGDGRVEGVRLADGTVIAADAVLVGVGTQPNTEWLARSGLDVRDGVACDQAGRAVGVPDVFAAGDVARWCDPTGADTTRVEHWTNAVDQARAVAATVLEPARAPDAAAGVPYFWSDQYGVKIQFVGRRTSHVEVVHGSVASRRFLALYHGSDGRLAGALGFDAARLIGKARRWVAASTTREDALQALAAAA